MPRHDLTEDEAKHTPSVKSVLSRVCRHRSAPEAMMPHVACHVRRAVSINPSRWVSPTTQPPPWFVMSPHGGFSSKTAKHLSGSRTVASMQTAQPPLAPSMRGMTPSKCNRQTSSMVCSVAPWRLEFDGCKVLLRSSRTLDSMERHFSSTQPPACFVMSPH